MQFKNQHQSHHFTSGAVTGRAAQHLTQGSEELSSCTQNAGSLPALSADWPQTLLQGRIQPGLLPEQGQLCQNLHKIFTEINPHCKNRIIQSNSSKFNSSLFLPLQEQGGRDTLSQCPAVTALTETSHGHSRRGLQTHLQQFCGSFPATPISASLSSSD